MANQHTVPSEDTQRWRILTFVRQHPNCTTRALSAEFGWSLSYVGMYLTRLKTDGLVQRERNRGELLARWSAVDRRAAPRTPAPLPVPAPVQRDPMIAALFGNAPAQVAA